jgi:hypothetical protein
MDNLKVNSKLNTIVVDDEDANAATTIVEGLGKTLEETALVKDGKTLLDIASLGHGNNAAILTDVKNAVLLEDGAEHVLDHDRGGRVGDEARLLMELLGEEVHTEVAVLASLRRGRDANDLARAALEDQEIANADVVAGDGDGVGGRHADGGCLLDDAFDGNAGWDARSRGVRGSGGSILLLDYDFFAADLGRGRGDVGVRRVGVGVVVVLGAVDGVAETISSFVKTVAERMIMSVFVVISHITLVLLLLNDYVRRSFTGLGRIARVYGLGLAASDTRRVGTRVGLLYVLGRLTEAGVGGEVVEISLLEASSGYDGTSAFTELALRDVDLGGSVLWSRGRGTSDGVEVAVVGFVLDLDLAADVALIGLLVAVSAGEFNCSNWASFGLFLVDMDLLAVVTLLLRLLGLTGSSVLLIDTNLLLEPGVAAVDGRLKGRGEGFKRLFVTFPSDVRSLRR